MNKILDQDDQINEIDKENNSAVVDITISPDMEEALTALSYQFINKHLDKVDISVFLSSIKNGDSLENAVGKAVVNNIMVSAITELLKENQ